MTFPWQALGLISVLHCCLSQLMAVPDAHCTQSPPPCTEPHPGPRCGIIPQTARAPVQEHSRALMGLPNGSSAG